MTTEQEKEIAEKHGFTPKIDSARGGNWCSFRKGSTRVWLGSPSRPWVRASLIDRRYRYHQSMQNLEDALKDANGKAFGPDSKS